MITMYTSPSEISYQYRITEHVFNRFGINPHNTDRVYENTALIEVDPNFLVDVLNVFCDFTDINYALFNEYSVPVIVDYLKRSHTYYLNKILPEIGQSISILLNNYDKTHPLLSILYQFYYKYKNDLETHFFEEEDFLFPYANRLYRTMYFKAETYLFINYLQNFSISSFIETHSDTVKELIKIKTILFEYEPSTTNKTSFRVLIEQINNFEKDLNIHAFLEDEVLIPKLLELEKNVRLEIHN